MTNDYQSSEGEKHIAGIHIGDVHGGIHDSIIAGGDVTIRAERLYVQATETEAPFTPEQRQELERLYLERIAAECRYLETEGVDRTRAELTDVFVMLEAVESPRRQAEVDVAPLPERAEEMGLKEWATSSLEWRQAEREEQVPFERRGREREEQASPLPPVPLSKALKEHNHLTILGEPGTGKTTTLQFIALCFATKGRAQAKMDLNEARVPVPIDLRAYEGAERLDRFLIQWLDHAYVPEPLVRDWLTEGRLAVLLDGLDEVPEARRAAVAEAIKRFAATSEGRRCRIVVTSRIAGYRESRRLGADFDQYTIRPFAGPEDSQPYVAGWLQALKPEAADDEAATLIGAMEQQGGPRRVMNNPLLLRLAVTVYVESGEIARNRAELYRRYVQEVTWKRVKAREEPHWSYSQIAQALEIVAWELQTGDERTEVTLVELIENEVAGVVDGRDLLNRLRERLGLLAVYGYERGNLVAFRHLTFQEYFVARRLKQAWERNSKRAWRFLRPRLHHPAWREPILLLAGMLEKGEATDLVRRILKARSLYERELHRDLLLAAALLGDGAPVSADVADKITNRLTQLSLAAWRQCELPSAQALLDLPWRLSGFLAWIPLREQVNSSLSRLPRPQRAQSAESSIQALGNKNRHIRSAAVRALVAIGIWTPGWISRMGGNNGKAIREPAASVLGKVSGLAVEPFIQALGDESEYVREAAAWTLGIIGCSRAIEPLIQALEDNNRDVREAAAEALMEIGGPAVKLLIGHLGSENWWVHETAARVLHRTLFAP
jgi:hypothetical protein